MKHTLTALALAAFAAGASAQNAAPAPVAASSTDLAVRGSVSWNGKNVFRGIERSSSSGLVQTAVTLEYNIPGFTGVSAYLNFFNADGVERTYTIGAKTDSSFGVLDVGAQRLTSPVARSIGSDGFTQLRADKEIYVGTTLSTVALKPSAYVYYSTDLHQYTLELAASKTFAGSSVGLSGFDIVTKVYGGVVDASATTYAAKNSYEYLGASVDVTRAIGQGAVLGAGANWAYNTDGQAKTAGSASWVRVFANFKF
jgi:uncharacterized membrane protein YuzA (DUF378 family)